MSTELTTPVKIEIPGIGTIESADFYLKSEADKVITHHKYKRCVAMAKICENRLGTVVKPRWWDKWRKIWLALAKKFKEVK